MNKVILIGRLARDPEMRTTGSGIAVTRFTIAVSRPFNPQNGQQGTDFIGCVAWRRQGQAENIAKYCAKGSQVAVEGRIQTGSYDGADGQKHYTTDIVAEEESLMESHDQDLEQHAAAKGVVPEEESDFDSDDEVVARAHDLLDKLGVAMSSSESDVDIPKAVEIVNNMNLSSTSDRDTADHTNENVSVELTGDELDSSEGAEMDNSHYATKVHSALVEEESQQAISHDEEESEVHVEGLDGSLQEDGELLDAGPREEESDQGLDLYEHNSGQLSQDELLPSDDE